MLSLKILILPNSLEIIREALEIALPAIPPEDLLEATARGLGFHSAAALTMAATHPAVIAEADGDAFAGYLAKKGHQTSGGAFYDAGALSALDFVARQLPALTSSGVGPYDTPAAEGREPTSEEVQELGQDRSSLTTMEAVPGFLHSTSFLSHLKKARKIDRDTTSYGLKHLAEQFPVTYPDGSALGSGYVRNG